MRNVGLKTFTEAMDGFRTAMSFRFFNWLTNNRIGFCLSQREFRLYLGLKIVQVPLGGIVRGLRACTIPQRFSIRVFFLLKYSSVPEGKSYSIYSFQLDCRSVR